VPRAIDDNADNKEERQSEVHEPPPNNAFWRWRNKEANGRKGILKKKNGRGENQVRGTAGMMIAEEEENGMGELASAGFTSLVEGGSSSLIFQFSKF